VNPYTTFTNTTDLLLTASLSNREWLGGSFWEEAVHMVRNTHKGGDLTFTMADIGLGSGDLKHMGAEWGDESAMRSWLNRGLAMNGFKAVEVLGNTTLINQTYRELNKRAMAKAGTHSRHLLEAEYRHAFGEDDYGEFLAALQKGNSGNLLVKSALLDRLFNQKPLHPDDLPLGHSKHPGWRASYALNTFMLKQIDLIRSSFIDRVKHGVKTGDKRLVAGATVDLIKYMTLFGGGTAGIRWMNDVLLDREVEISDRTLNYALNLIGVNRYAITRFERELSNPKIERLAGIIGTQILPASARIIYDNLIPDLQEEATGDIANTGAYRKLKILGMDMGWTGLQDILPATGGRFWKYMPLIGRDVYWSIGRGRLIEERRRQKRQRERGKHTKSPGLKHLYERPEFMEPVN
jgi:hypothetical protein